MSYIRVKVIKPWALNFKLSDFEQSS